MTMPHERLKANCEIPYIKAEYPRVKYNRR